MSRRKKKRRIKWKNIFLVLIILICLIMLISSLIKIIIWKIETDKTNKQIDNIQGFIREEIDDDNNLLINEGDTIIVDQEEEIPEFNPYWDYINMKLINVDFLELKKINSDTVGWIQVNGTRINYPFVQTKDNDFYLNHSFDKSGNGNGWVFLDYRNDINTLDKNTIIYAHGGNNATLFGGLKNILKTSWINNTDNFVVKLSTEGKNTLWQVFSVYRIPTTSDYIQVNFNSDESFKDWALMLKDRSDYDFKTNISGFDKVLTLSTCYNDYDKVVLHAKLIKEEKR